MFRATGRYVPSLVPVNGLPSCRSAREGTAIVCVETLDRLAMIEETHDASTTVGFETTFNTLTEDGMFGLT